MSDRPPAPRRVVAYARPDGGVEASQAFYVDVLGFDVAMRDPYLGLVSPADDGSQVMVIDDDSRPWVDFGVDLGDPAAVDAAHARAVEQGLRIVYPLTDEPWGVRRFFVEDPGGTVVNVLAHHR